jgi:hypothetical protein
MHKTVLIIAALTGGFLLALIGHARSHDWYPWECCSDRDCAPIEASDVDEKAEGFTIKSTGEFIERSRVRVAPDDQFHLCRNQSTNAIICFFQPNRGV